MNDHLYQWAGVSDPWALVQSIIKAGATRIFLSGDPGIGKSWAGTHAQMEDSGQEVYQITLNEDTTAQEIIGHFVPKGNVFEFNYGPAARAMLDGCTLVVNELQRASDAVKDAFLGILDDPEIASIALPNGENLKPHKGFRVIATSNLPISELDPALQDRFDAVLHLQNPNPAIIEKLNGKMAGLGDAVRDSYRDSKRAISPRRALAFVYLVEKGMPVKQAALVAFSQRSEDFVMALQSRGVAV